MNPKSSSYEVIDIFRRKLEQLFSNFFKTYDNDSAIDTIYLAQHVVKMLNFRGIDDEDTSLWLTTRAINREFRDAYSKDSLYVNLCLIKTSKKMVINYKVNPKKLLVSGNLQSPEEADENFAFIKRYGFPTSFVSKKKIAFYECIKCGAQVIGKNRSKHLAKYKGKSSPPKCETCNLLRKDHVPSSTYEPGEQQQPRRYWFSDYYRICPLSKIKCSYCGDEVNSIVYLTHHKDLCKRIYNILPYLRSTNSTHNCSRLRCSTKFHRKPTLVCSGCYYNRYCSINCQKSDWDTHKETCHKLRELHNSPHLSTLLKKIIKNY